MTAVKGRARMYFGASIHATSRRAREAPFADARERDRFSESELVKFFTKSETR
jgi:hypothetical protein